MEENKLLQLIQNNKRLICSIINKYTKYYEFDDLYQVSVIGMMKASQNYDESYNVKFTTYAYKYILSEVIQYVNNSNKKLTLLDIYVSDDSNKFNYLLLEEELNALSKEEQELINYRYFQDKTQSEIAQIFGTNQVKISRNEQKILKKLKNNLCKSL